MLPTWHREEKDYRDWYFRMVDGFVHGGEPYEAYVRAFRLPEQVRGYREVSWPQMKAAQRTAEYWIDRKGEPQPIDGYVRSEPVQEHA